jgi:SAM-dependent methyltransferase
MMVAMSVNVCEYYSERYNEDARHDTVFGQIQHARTCELLDRFITGRNLTIADIGGATGVYAFYLAERGHHVHLIDLVPAYIELAQQRNQQAAVKLAGCHIADARAIDFANDTFERVLSHGPLYHLVDKAERVKALKEAYRVLKPNGTILAFAINRYAGVFYGIHNDLMLDTPYAAIVSTEIATGQRMREPGWHFHLPGELRGELLETGFDVLHLLGVVGPTWMLPDAEDKWRNASTRQQMLALSRQLEHEPIIGPDILCIGQKPR